MASKRTPRAPGESPALFLFVAALKGAIVLVSVFALLIVGWMSWWWWRPDLLVNPINQQVHIGFLACRDGGQCPSTPAGWQSMIPELLEPGEPREAAIRQVREAGYAEWFTEGNEANYRRSGASLQPLFCTAIYNIRLVFDASDRLETAESTFSGTPSCL